MNCGKSTAVIQVAYNYEERGMKVLLIKPKIDTKGADTIVSRLGAKRKVDILAGPKDDLFAIISEMDDIGCVLIDESQFLTKKQIDQLFRLVVVRNIPVICYGLRADFKTNAFEGSKRLFELAHSLEELKTICRCGKKALFNGRKVDGEFVSEGSQVAIDGESDVTYESLCGNCYLTKVSSRLS